ncbi:Ldh family oxidoreductase [bacterium]|nr:Ldh family oxidoreductase [bacterium]
MDEIRIDFDLLNAFMKDVFIKVGVPEKDAEVCADVLITADKYGIDSHGVSRFKPIYIDRILRGQVSPVTSLEIVRQAPSTSVMDGHNGMGMVIAKEAMQTAIDKAGQTGMGMVAVRDSNHFGIAGYYARMAVNAGMIGIVGTNARPSIAPTFGIENMLGTNPWTVGIPTDEAFPFLLDCATSVSQRGKIEVYARTGKPLPAGWVVGEDGRYRTDAAQVLDDLIKGRAALVPVGGVGEETAGYKGYGYATVVEILSAALQGGAFLKMLTGLNEKGESVPYRLGHFFIAAHIESFTTLEAFRKTAGEICRNLRNSRKIQGAERIYTAGEKEYLIYEDRKDKGALIDKALLNVLTGLREQFHMDHYQFTEAL